MNDTDSRLAKLELEVKAIKERNEKVEGDKAWETSRFRLICLLVITFLFTALVFWLIGVENCLRNALIPTLAYLISTRTIPILRKWWIHRYLK